MPPSSGAAKTALWSVRYQQALLLIQTAAKEAGDPPRELHNMEQVKAGLNTYMSRDDLTIPTHVTRIKNRAPRTVALHDPEPFARAPCHDGRTLPADTMSGAATAVCVTHRELSVQQRTQRARNMGLVPLTAHAHRNTIDHTLTCARELSSLGSAPSGPRTKRRKKGDATKDGMSLDDSDDVGGPGNFMDTEAGVGDDSEDSLGLAASSLLGNSDDSLETELRQLPDTTPQRVRPRATIGVASSESDSDSDSVDISSVPKRRRIVASESDESDTSSDDFTGVPAPVHAPTLAEMHPVPEFDGRCVLVEHGDHTLRDGTVIACDHTYIVDGHDTTYTSSTTFVKDYFEEFDADAITAKMVQSARWTDSPYYEAAMQAVPQYLQYETSDRLLQTVLSQFRSGDATIDDLRDAADTVEVLGEVEAAIQQACAAQIKDVWKQATELGTAMHDRLEHFFRGDVAVRELEQEAETTREIRHFLAWRTEWLEVRGWKPFRMELRIFDTTARICGAVDALFVDPRTNELHMVDWKRSKGLTRQGFRGKMAQPPLDHMPDCNLSKYQLQQNIYKYILERNSTLRLSSMQLVVLHPNQDTYHVEPIPVLTDEVEALFRRSGPALSDRADKS